MVRQLVLQVDEIRDKNEELEFQVLELEGSHADVKVGRGEWKGCRRWWVEGLCVDVI